MAGFKESLPFFLPIFMAGFIKHLINNSSIYKLKLKNSDFFIKNFIFFSIIKNNLPYFLKNERVVAVVTRAVTDVLNLVGKN